VKFLNDFHGVIDSFSLPRPMSAKEWQASMGAEDEEKDVAAVHEARIVYVDHGARSVRLSMRPHVLDFRGPHGLPPLGSILQGLRIKFAAKKQGILLSQGDVEATDATLAMSIVSRVGDKLGEGKVKGAARLDKKMVAADAKRRKEINESVLGVFIHKSSLAERRADAEDEDVSSDGKEKQEEKVKGKGKSLPVSEADLEKRYKVGEQVQQVKVIGYHLAEGFAVGTNMETAITSEVLHWSKISVGQVLTATIAAIRDFGLLIKISANVQAVCPLLHLSDTGLTLTTVQLNKKFKVGQTHKVRVWEADGNAILVTMKKSIVDDKTIPILSYADAVAERVSLGVVSRADEKGLKVNFFNGVKGMVPMGILARQGVADAADSYRAGQVVKCLVLKRSEPKEQSSKNSKAPAVPKVTLALAVGSCDAAEIQSLLAALVPEGESRADTATNSAVKAVVGDAAASSGDAATGIVQKKAVGEFVSGVVYKVDTESISVRLSDGRLGTMLKHQAADFAATTDIYFGVSGSAAKKASYYSIGSKIVNALVLSTNKKILSLSMKPLLLTAASNKAESAAEALSVPNSVADLVPGQVVAGFIFKVESYGVMVRFREGLTALVPRPNVADRFLATPEGLFNVGDSVRCVIQRVDLARERVIATFKSAVVGPSRGDSSFLKSLLRESCLAATFLAASESKLLPAWDKISLFTVVSATVSSIESYGVVLTAADQTTTMLARGIHSKTTVTVGQTTSVLVLDVDFKNKVLDVTMDSDLIKGVTSKSANASKASKKKSALGGEAALRVKGSVLTGRVELVQAGGRYLVVSIEKCALAYVALTDYHCPIVTAPSDYAEHQEVSVKVETPSNAGGGGGDSPHTNCAILSICTGTAKDQVAPGSSSSEDRKSVDAAALKKKFLDTIRLGAVLKWRVVAVTPIEVTVKPDYVEVMGLSVKASVHITGTVDQTAGTDDLVKVLTSNAGAERGEELGPNHPFFGISIGSKLLGRVQQIRHHTAAEAVAETDLKSKKAASKAEAEDKIVICLSTVGLERGLKFDASKGDEAPAGKRKREGEEEKSHPLLQLYGKNAIKERGVYAGCITKIDDTGCYVAFSPFISCRLHFMDVSKDEEVVKMFMQKAIVGQRVLAQVTSFSFDAKAAGKAKPKGAFISRATVESHMKEGGATLSEVCAAAISSTSAATGDLTPGLRTFGILDLRSHRHRYQIPRPPALQVYLGGGRVGRVCVTELSDPSSWKDCAYLMGAPSSSSSSSKAVLQLPNGGKHGDLVQCRVLAINGKSNTGSSDIIEVSLRPSRLVSTQLQPYAIVCACTASSLISSPGLYSCLFSSPLIEALNIILLSTFSTGLQKQERSHQTGPNSVGWKYNPGICSQLQYEGQGLLPSRVTWYDRPGAHARPRRRVPH
jgi:ribosomal protein S1